LNLDGSVGSGHTAASDYFSSAQGAGNIAGHALVGGLSSVASGGSFQSGFISAGFSAYVGPTLASIGEQNIITESVSGGVGSVLGGGKFQNGAITGAFGYLYNDAGAIQQSQAWGAGAAGYNAQEQIDTLWNDITDRFSLLAGVSGEGTADIGISGAGGIYMTLKPFDIGGFLTIAGPTGVNFGLGPEVGAQIGGLENFRGAGSTVSINSPAGGVSTNFNSQGELIGLTYGFPGRGGGASAGTTRSCSFSLRQLSAGC
jgi:hypothetical protein